MKIKHFAFILLTILICACGIGIRIPTGVTPTPSETASPTPLPSPTPTEVFVIPAGGTSFNAIVQAEDGLYLRRNPSLSAEILAIIPDKSQIVISFYIYDANANILWYQTTWRGQSGYVSNNYLTIQPPNLDE